MALGDDAQRRLAVVRREHVVAVHPEHERHALRRVHVVVDHENHRPAPTRLRIDLGDAWLLYGRGGCGGPASEHPRQADRELASLARPLAPGDDRTAMFPDQALDQRETDAEPSLSPLDRGLHLRKEL